MINIKGKSNQYLNDILNNIEGKYSLILGEEGFELTIGQYKSTESHDILIRMCTSDLSELLALIQRFGLSGLGAEVTIREED